jgi:NTP pyrophosphatase (non-canonical NTP hydrolase)
VRFAAIGIGGQRPSEHFQDILENGPIFARDAQLALTWLNGINSAIVDLGPIFDGKDVTAIPDIVSHEIRRFAPKYDAASYVVPDAGNLGDESVRHLASDYAVDLYPGRLELPKALSGARVVDALSLAIAEAAYPFDAGLASLDPNCATVITNFSGAGIIELASKRLTRELGTLPDLLRPGLLIHEATTEARETPDFSGLERIVSILRSPDGCPWDREQTVKSLLPQLIEEIDEFRDACSNGTAAEQAEELGDVLLHIVMIAQIAREAGKYTSSDVLSSISAKMVRRHPHVFGDLQIDTFEELYSMWDEIKSQEKADKE